MLCREECAALRLELTARHKEESQATRAELVSRKEKELQEERHKWQTEVERLKEMVSAAVSMSSMAMHQCDIYVRSMLQCNMQRVSTGVELNVV